MTVLLGLVLVGVGFIAVSVLRSVLVVPRVECLHSCDAPRMSATLVHGTWARSANWTNADAPLVQLLLDRYGNQAEVYRLRWSGANSIVGRAHAADALSKHLQERVSKFPKVEHLILGHSHGGNIALYGIAKLLEPRPPVRVVTLATPFIVERPRGFGAFLGRQSNIPLVTPCLVAASGWMGHHLGWSLWRVLGVSLIALPVAILISGFLSRSWRALAEHLAVSLEYPELQHDQLLVIRAPGDEATGLLTFVSVVPTVLSGLLSLPFRACSAALYHIANRLMAFALHLNCLPVIGQRSAEADTTYDLRPIPWLFGSPAIALAFGLLSLPLQPILAGLILVEALALLPFGPELAFLSWEHTVSVEATPPGDWRVMHIPKPWAQALPSEQWFLNAPLPLAKLEMDRLGFDPVGDDFPRLMHGVPYQSLAALEAIHQWLGHAVTNVGTTDA